MCVCNKDDVLEIPYLYIKSSALNICHYVLKTHRHFKTDQKKETYGRNYFWKKKPLFPVCRNILNLFDLVCFIARQSYIIPPINRQRSEGRRQRMPTCKKALHKISISGPNNRHNSNRNFGQRSPDNGNNITHKTRYIRNRLAPLSLFLHNESLSSALPSALFFARVCALCIIIFKVGQVQAHTIGQYKLPWRNWPHSVRFRSRDCYEYTRGCPASEVSSKTHQHSLTSFDMRGNGGYHSSSTVYSP